MFFYFKYEDLIKCCNFLNLGQKKKAVMQYWQRKSKAFWLVCFACVFPQRILRETNKLAKKNSYLDTDYRYNYSVSFKAIFPKCLMI